jgi:hypothetical protein
MEIVDFTEVKKVHSFHVMHALKPVLGKTVNRSLQHILLQTFLLNKIVPKIKNDEASIIFCVLLMHISDW